MVSREVLASIRTKALRRGVWYKVLNRIERSIVDLTIKCVDRIRSPLLARVVGRIVCKVLKALRSPFLMRVERVGYELAERLCQFAEKWGYVGASSWKHDVSFVRCLGINAIGNAYFR